MTGSQGIFGYRCNTSYVSTKGNDFYEQEKAGAIAIVEALKAKGYRLACYTYENGKYRDMNSAGITADLQSWTPADQAHYRRSGHLRLRPGQ